MTHESTARDILIQLGYYRRDTAFVALNLTPVQWDVMQHALSIAPLPPDSSIETQLTEILSQWLTAQETTHGNRNAIEPTDRLAATA